MKVPVAELGQLARIAAPLIKQFGGGNPLLTTLGTVISGLADQHGGDKAAVPIRQEIDTALAGAIEDRRKASQDARDALKPL